MIGEGIGDFALRCRRGDGSVNDAAGGLDPFAGRGEGGVGFDGGDDSVRGNIAFIGAFDDSFESATHVAAAFGEESKGVGVIVNSALVAEHEAAVDGHGAVPVDEHFLDGFAFRMVADEAFALVMGEMGGGGCSL